MNELNYIIKRLLQIIPVLFCVTVLIFIMMRLIPGDPALVMLGDKGSPETIAAMRHQMGLDQSYLTQYWIFLNNLLHMNLGKSVYYNQPVSELIQQKILVTITLTIVSTILAILISFPLGYLSGINRGNLKGQIINAGSLVAVSLPSFWIGLLFLILFGLKLGWFPIAGWGQTWPEHIYSMILPGLTQALATCALLIRNIQNSVSDILKKDYVDFAYSKGLPRKIVRSRYIIKNVMVSTVTLFSMRIAYMLGGSVVIETVFALPGIGLLLLQGILGRDYAIVQGTVFIFAVIVLAMNLFTDISYSILDPRVKLQ
ncbi:ABC transporter permease [Desulfosporosinus sp. FKB]|uniref:ABC transporter permease n=1 Tax=Desulfosporosinus sp. FKB TaxID=1969835 RepID=UPI000B4A158E|nr:ABC transporter permease [Desulfosporosinus sp. FKB]